MRTLLDLFHTAQISTLIFSSLSFVAMAWVHLWLRRTRKTPGVPRFAWLLLFFFVLSGAWLANKAALSERDSVRRMLQGFAPTYANEMKHLGHERMRLDTPADDPLYLTLINAEKDWLELNPLVNDIYTFRMLPDGTIVLLVDSETDYDHNGRYEGEREQRTAIGEVYPQAGTNLKIAFQGFHSFDDEPYTDRWGTWVSAYAPIYDSQGHVEGVLGVDYAAGAWMDAIARRRMAMLAYVGMVIIAYIAGIAVFMLGRYERSQRSLAQEKLLQSALENQRLAQAVNAASDGIVMTDPNQPDNPLIYANEMFLKITGYSMPEVIGRNLRYLQGPETDLVTVDEVRKAIRERKPTKVTILNKRKDGTRFWNGLRISPVFFEEKLQYFLGVVADVTQRKEDEMALIAERDYTTFIMESAPIVICSIDANGMTNSINPSGERVTGYTAKELVGKNWWDTFFPGEGRRQVEKLFQELESSRHVNDFEMTLISKTGQKRTISWNAICYSDTDGKIAEIVGFGNDITERKNAEEELNRNEEAFRFMMLSAPVMVWMADANKKFIYVNRFWAEFTGHKPSEELGDGWMTGVHADDRASLIAAYEAAYRDRINFKTEFRLLHVSGEYRWVINTGTPSLRDDGTFAGFIGSCLDVHERKKLESQLLQAQKMETVGTLAGGIAHDLNNQLTPLSGYIDLLMKETPEADPNRGLLVEAEQAARRCAEVVQRLMGFSRTSTQKKNWFKTESMLDELKNLLPKLLPKTIEVQVAHPEGLWPVMGNETELQTIFMNLATNARDAMPEGGKLLVSAENKELDVQSVRTGYNPGPYVVFEVKDTGQGIQPESLPKIFEPFFTTKQKGSGTGLGLAMVFRIIKDHGGWIDVSSILGKGTVFRLHIPAEPKQGVMKTTAVSETLPRGNETILFVDDEEALRNIGRVFLERLGYKVLLAQDGEEAVRLYEQRRQEISAVVMDMTMPKLTGKQAMKKMMQIDPKVRVLLASGYTSEGSAKELIQDGAADFLPKPYTIMPLAQALRKVIGKP